MTNDSTLTKLHEMRLSDMAEQYNDQLLNPKYNELTFEDRFGLLVDVEWGRRKNNKLDRLIKTANLRYNHTCVEDIEYNYQGSFREWKSYLSSAFGVATWRQFYNVK